MGKDPAFLFYDGDAARDVSHMNRLERGCYFDFIQAQKKFGPLTMPVIQKILGKDFSECWPALKICLTCVEDMFFISWLQNSIEKRQKYSEGRAKNRKGSKQPKNESQLSTYVNHMENAIVNENAIELKLKESLDEIYIDGQRPKWGHIDFDFEYNSFCEKVRGSPGHYANHDTGAIRLAFQSQLRHAKKKTNGTPKDKRSQHLEDLATDFAKRASESP